jgi:urocanate hydratase
LVDKQPECNGSTLSREIATISEEEKKPSARKKSSREKNSNRPKSVAPNAISKTLKRKLFSRNYKPEIRTSQTSVHNSPKASMAKTIEKIASPVKKLRKKRVASNRLS